MHTAMWIIPIAPFILAIATTWSLREAIEETVWFNVAYVGVLALIYAIDMAGFDVVSTSPTGPGGRVNRASSPGENAGKSERIFTTAASGVQALRSSTTT